MSISGVFQEHLDILTLLCAFVMNRLHKLLFIVLACSAQQALGGTIINGREVPPNSLPYMASVQHHGEHICGGFLIRKDIVLTAAHCDKKELTVVLGTNDLRKVKKTMRYHVKKCKHADFDNSSLANDIMTLKLSSPSQIEPIQLPNGKMKIKNNTPCLVAGWGSIMSGGPGVEKLREVDVATIDRRICKQRWTTLPAKTICAGGYPTNKGFCQGDSGGPLVCNTMAVGIVSYTGDTCDYPHLPNVYTDITKFLPWINDPKAKCKIA
ncbi:duodenase-1-like [Gadus chalcogrammus]|uniref:duodenase-1-like n=1 Tax=Gadus chalcogrammus TaxID=1042646 RepID=UPI0024C4CE23|nr:duodenase-1-like [Gadus chalcogrammus]